MNSSLGRFARSRRIVRFENSAQRLGFALLFLVVLAAVAGCAASSGERSEGSDRQRGASAEESGAESGAPAVAESAEQQWNRLDLLDHFAPIGEAESDWDSLASAQSFALLQRALEEMRQLVLADAASEQEAAEGLRMLLKVFAMAADDSLRGDLANPLFRRLDSRWRDVAPTTRMPNTIRPGSMGATTIGSRAISAGRAMSA